MFDLFKSVRARINRDNVYTPCVDTPWFDPQYAHILDFVSENVNGRLALGAIIRAFRERDQRALSQERFAEVADIDRTYYASIERGEGNPSFEMLWTIVSTLGLTWQEFGRALDENSVLRRRPPARSQRRQQ